ncbi:MAG: hypothetical protein OHK0029_29160 [Armatimonadaceae bacterium]
MPENIVTRLLCDYLIPAQVVLLLLFSLPPNPAPLRERIAAALPFWIRCAVCIAVAVVIARAGKVFEVWNGHPGFPSGHANLAFAVATCMALARSGKWALWSYLLAFAMLPSLVFHGAHDIPEVLGGATTGTVIPALVWWGITKYGWDRKLPTTPPTKTSTGGRI